ncbi:hypothetical protein ACJJTC_019776 [Scirpophaga incertulas]
MAISLVLVILLVTVSATHKHHPRFRKVECSIENDSLRHEMVQKSRCGPPKEVFIYLQPQAAHEEVNPGAVWVKRCVGLCDYATFGSLCIPTKSVMKHIPIRIYNVKTNKESCSTYPVEEHVSCHCCAPSDKKCGENHVFNPRKCICQCSNYEERRSCIRKRNQNMKWNRAKCACEPIKTSQ